MFGRDVMAGLVWSRGVPERLLGFFPVRIERRRYGIPMPVLVGWTHPYGPLGTPLVDRECSEAAVAAWLDHVAAGPGAAEAAADAVSCRREGAVAQRSKRRSSRAAAAAPISRRIAARCCAPTASATGYLDARDAAQEAQGTAPAAEPARRLGAVTSETHDRADPAHSTAALNDFLALEASGWKGRAGTAARGNDGDPPLRRTGGDRARRRRQGERRAAALGGRAVAARSDAAQRRQAWCWKIAYDEGFRPPLAGRATPARRDRAPARRSRASCAPIPAPRPTIR